MRKLLIHPEQIEPVNEIFSPSLDEIAYYKRVIETFKEAEANGLEAVSLEGRMIDVANYRQAEDALVLAEGIAEKEHKRKERGR